VLKWQTLKKYLGSLASVNHAVSGKKATVTRMHTVTNNTP
jgi:hypothetical protein